VKVAYLFLLPIYCCCLFIGGDSQIYIISIDFRECFFKQIDKNDPITQFTNALFTKLNHQCDSSIVTYQDKFTLEQIVDQTSKSVVYDDLITQLTQRQLLSTTNAFWQCFVSVAESNYPIPQFANKIFTNLNHLCDTPNPSYQDKLILKDMVLKTQDSTDFNDVYVQLVQRNLLNTNDTFWY